MWMETRSINKLTQAFDVFFFFPFYFGLIFMEKLSFRIEYIFSLLIHIIYFDFQLFLIFILFYVF